jgi:protein-disulfide isomerase
VNGTPTFFVNGTRYDGSWANEQAFIGALRDAARQGVRAAVGSSSR